MTMLRAIKRYMLAMLCMVLLLGMSGLTASGEADAASEYKKFFDISRKGAPIPGLSGTKEWVPQGLALVPSKHWIIISLLGQQKQKSSQLHLDHQQQNE